MLTYLFPKGRYYARSVLSAAGNDKIPRANDDCHAELLEIDAIQ